MADALSRRDEEAAIVRAKSVPQLRLFDDIRVVTINVDLQEHKRRIEEGTLQAPWSMVDGIVVYDSRIFLPYAASVLPSIVGAIHYLGHEGIQKTLNRLRADFHIPGDRQLVIDWVRGCATCQHNKTGHLHLSGLLQLLEVPHQVWANISMDFIEGLPCVNNKSVILTVVDLFSKYVHFIPLPHPYTTTSDAHAFFDEIVRLHGILA